MSSPLTRIQTLPQLADRAVHSTLEPAYGTVVLCGLIMALMNGGFVALMALLGTTLDSTVGSLVLVGSVFAWMPLMFGLSVIIYGMLAVHGAHRATLSRDLSFFGTLRYFFRPTVFFTVVLMVCAIAVATVFLILPGLLVAVLLSLTIPVMVAERRSLMDAMLRSAGLIWRNPEGRLLTSPIVRVLGLTTVMVVLSTLMTLVFQIPAQLLAQGVIFRETLSGAEVGASSMLTVNLISLPFSIATALVGVGVYSYFFHALGSFYRDLVERREAPALEAAIEELASPFVERATGLGSFVSAGPSTQSDPSGETAV